MTKSTCKKITLFSNDHYYNYKNDKESKTIIKSIELFQSNYAERYDTTKAHEFLFYYDDIEDIFDETLHKWYSDSQSAYPIKQHLISSLNHPNVFTSLDFLIVMQALEGYALRFEEAGKGFTTSIQYLIRLFQDIDKVRNIDFEVKIAINSRNYYSHFYTKKEDRQILDGYELYKLTQKMRLLLICCVLRLAGFDNQRINKILNKSHNRKLEIS